MTTPRRVTNTPRTPFRAARWEPMEAEQWAAAVTPPEMAPTTGAKLANSAIIELVAMADRWVAGSALLVGGAWSSPSVELLNATAVPGVEDPAAVSRAVVGVEVGAWLSRADLRARTDRTKYALALGHCARLISVSARPAARGLSRERDAGWVQVAAVGGAVIVAGVAVAWLVDRASEMILADRAMVASVAAASRDSLERFRQHAANPSAPMLPPTPIELAAAAAVDSAAAAAREDGLGQHLERASSTLAKLGFGLGVAYVVGQAIASKGR